MVFSNAAMLKLKFKFDQTNLYYKFKLLIIYSLGVIIRNAETNWNVNSHFETDQSVFKGYSLRNKWTKIMEKVISEHVILNDFL